MDLSTLFTSPESRSILLERAKALALQDQTMTDEVGEPTLSFLLGSERYCLPAPSVRETQRLTAVTKLPAVPASIVGLVNVRGRLIACVDIRPLLDLPPAPPHAESLLLIVTGSGVEIGLLVDEVTEVRARQIELDPGPSASSGRGVTWVRGVDEALNVHIDPDLLLRDARLVVNDTPEPTPAPV